MEFKQNKWDKVLFPTVQLMRKDGCDFLIIFLFYNARERMKSEQLAKKLANLSEYLFNGDFCNILAQILN